MHPLGRLGLIANRVLSAPVLIPLAVIVLGLLIAVTVSGCADPYVAPPAKPGIAIWRTDTAAGVARSCGNANAMACAKVEGGFCLIVTRVPDRMDTSFGEVAAHEWAHCEGWNHPQWPNSRAVRP